ncbi:MAG: nuclear transport factor 2 family protein [Bacteroidetes bacterium]|nr:nuclear transport factor 2 family protein [Bacteroidota bacterium]
MKSLLFIFAISLTTLGYSQTEFTNTEAKEIVDVFFDGFHKGDTTLMKSVMATKVPLQTAFTDKEGNHTVSNGDLDNLLKAIADRPSDQKWDERLLGYEIQIDGNLAHVWTPYEFWFNDTFSHCGANAFTLAKTNTGWKIIHLIDSRRKSSCKQN